MSQEEFLKIACIAIIAGVFLGIIFVLWVKIQRKNTVVNSLISSQKLIGKIGIVQLPFNENSKGKVRISLQGNLLDFTALTNLSYSFEIGEKVLVIEVKDGKIWVIPEDYLRKLSQSE